MGVDDLEELEEVRVKPLPVIPTIRARLASLTDLVMAMYTEGVTLRFTGWIVGKRRWFFIIAFGRTEPRFHENDTGGWN
jgi:hypothetical protein